MCDTLADSREPGVTNGPMTAIGMWGCMPVWITGVLVEQCPDVTVTSWFAQ